MTDARRPTDQNTECEALRARVASLEAELARLALAAQEPEASLRRSVRRWRQAERVARIGNWEFDLRTGRIWGSEEAFRIFGLPLDLETNPEQDLSLEAVEALIPEQERVHQALVDLVERKRPYDLEYELRGSEGEGRKVIHSKAERLDDPDGSPRKVFGTIQDITEWRRQQRALEESEQRYRRLTESASDLIWTIAADGQVTFVNSAVGPMLGYRPDEVVGMRQEDYFTPEGLRQGEAAAMAALSENPPRLTYSVEVEYRHKDGHGVPTEAIVNTFLGPMGFPVRFEGISRDISERRRVEQERLRLEERLRQSQRLESIGRLAGGVAHDFNNILTGIGGCAELVLDGLDAQDPLREELEEIQAAVERASELVRQLLAFSRQQIIQPRVVAPGEVLGGAFRLLRRLVGEDISLVVESAPETGRIRVDPGQMEQILVNLAANARDAMAVGGHLRIQTANVTLAEGEWSGPEELAPGEYVRLTVCDTGHGMDRETQERIFEPFFSTKAAGRGTGLGLATVYGIVRQNRGGILVRSAPENGSVFELYFPRVYDEPDAVAPARGAGSPAGTETILLVEDEDAVRRLVERVLSRLGYHVLAARDGEEALRLVAEYPAPIHLLLSDVVMPGLDGSALRDLVWEKRPNVPVLFVSGYAEDVPRRRGGGGVLGAFLPKPFSASALALKVREVLDQDTASGRS